MAIQQEEEVYNVPTNFRQLLFYEQFLEAKRLNPEYPFAFTLSHDTPDARFGSVNYTQFLSDVFQVAEALQRVIPKREPGTNPRTIGILGRSSYAYAVHWVACSVNHWTPVLISTKNSRDAVVHLLKVSNAAYLLVDKYNKTFARSMELVELSIVDFLAITPVEEGYSTPVHGEKLTTDQRAKEMDVPAFYLHTSGSTGHPKIIGISHKVLGAWQDTNSRELPIFERSVMLLQSPLFHAFGCFVALAISTSCGSINLITSNSKPHTAESLMKEAKMLGRHLDASSLTLRRFGVKEGFLTLTVPSILIDLAANGVEEVKSFAKLSRGALFGGAPLPLETGDFLTDNGVCLYSGFGMTEIGLLSKLEVSLEPKRNGEWRYIGLRSGYKYHWVPTDESHEHNKLVILPDTDSTAVFNQENPLGFDTNDIWIEHPTRKGWFRHDGRAGDITVLANGEKTDNKQLHSILVTRDNKIAHAIVFGSGRSQNGLLIASNHPIYGPVDKQKFVEDIWPAIEYMNSVVPAHSRIVKELVLVEDPSLPFRLTDKGTVREKITLNLYKDIINGAYEALESRTQAEEIEFPTELGNVEVERIIRAILKTLLPEGEIGGDVDLFEIGMDSLLAVRLRSYIVQLLKKFHPSSVLNVPKNILYDRPTINALVEYILTLASSDSSTQEDSDDVVSRIHRLVERHSAGFIPRSVNHEPNHDDGMEYVIVTGTTGSLGSFLVDQLLNRRTVKKIYCFNRKSDVDTTKRQLAGFKDRGLDPAKLEKALGDRVLLFDVDLSLSRLGLSEDVYAEIQAHVTHIIHNAWQLNFKFRMEGFEKTHIAGTRHLIDLALSSPRTRSPRFVFLSSISAVMNYKGSGGVPEEPVLDEHLAALGYGQSKLVGERVTEIAAKEAGLNAGIVRIGQISGSSTAGAWQKSEYMPILFRSCFGLGMVPNDLSAVRWLPSDVTASVVLKQTFSKNGNDGMVEYFHLENPTSTPWNEIADVIAHYKRSDLLLVPLQQWLSEARKHGIEDADKVPAIRLLETYENLADAPILDVQLTLAVAPELNFGQVTTALLAHYLDYQLVV